MQGDPGVGPGPPTGATGTTPTTMTTHHQPDPTRHEPTDPDVPGTTLACEADHPDEWVIYDRHSQDTAWIQGKAFDPTDFR